MNPEIVLPLDKMSAAEKIEVMELIWTDLCKNPSDVPVPDWHKEVLDERSRAVKAGEAKYLDWEDAIKEIRRRTS